MHPMIRCLLVTALLIGAANAQAAPSDAKAAPAGASGSGSANYPNRAIRLIVPFPPGGASDIVARVVAQKITQSTGQAVIVDNRGGAGGTIGSESGARAAPDGYTLTLATASSHGVAPSLYKNLSYDPLKDFETISLVVTTPFVLAVNNALPAHSVKDVIALAKKEPGKLNFASAGVGSSNQLTVELFKLMAGVNIVHVPYKGSGPALLDLVSGRVQLVINDMSSLMPFIKSDRVRALAVTSLKRSKALPDLPTIDQAGLPGYEALAWYGVLAPRGTPKAIVAKLNGDITRLIGTPEMRQSLSEQGFDVIVGTPDQFHRFMASEIEKWGKVIKAAGITAE